MKIDPATAAKVLTDLLKEDRAETRIWRSRLENFLSSAVLASFGLSAFLISKGHWNSMWRFLSILWLVDTGLVAVLSIVYRQVRFDLVEMRKALKYRETLLDSIDVNEPQSLELFKDPNTLCPPLKPGIRDEDLPRLFWLSIIVIVLKALILTAFAISFLARQN